MKNPTLFWPPELPAYPNSSPFLVFRIFPPPFLFQPISIFQLPPLSEHLPINSILVYITFQSSNVETSYQIHLDIFSFLPGKGDLEISTKFSQIVNSWVFYLWRGREIVFWGYITLNQFLKFFTECSLFTKWRVPRFSIMKKKQSWFLCPEDVSTTYVHRYSQGRLSDFSQEEPKIDFDDK